MEKQSIIVIIYNISYYFYYKTKVAPFFYWLKQIKAVKNIHEFNLSDFYVYIDTEKINYSQTLSLWSIFEAFKVNNREQVEKLLPYLPQGDVEDFDRYYLDPWKKKQLKKKKANQPINSPLITIIYSNINYWNIDGKSAFFHGLSQIEIIKEYKELKSGEVHIYVDPQDINYAQIIDLFRIFDVYRAEGREQLEQLLPYLSCDSAKLFEKNFLIPLKNKKLNKELTDE